MPYILQELNSCETSSKLVTLHCIIFDHCIITILSIASCMGDSLKIIPSYSTAFVSYCIRFLPRLFFLVFFSPRATACFIFIATHSYQYRNKTRGWLKSRLSFWTMVYILFCNFICIFNCGIGILDIIKVD